MDGTEDLAALFFELSSSSRLDILLELEKESFKLSQISKELDMSIQEASRHLTRLCDAKLVDKGQEGQYVLTPFGKYICTLFPTLDFLSMNADYFSTHDISVIPEQFRYGFGHIESHKRSEHVMESFRYTEELIRNAENFIWIHSDQVLSSTLPLIQQAVAKGVEFRLILPRNVVEEQHSDSDEEVPEEYRVLVHQRFPDKVEVILVMSEKEAILALPYIDGNMDYVGFSITGPNGIKWCLQMFLYFWEKAA